KLKCIVLLRLLQMPPAASRSALRMSIWPDRQSYKNVSCETFLSGQAGFSDKNDVLNMIPRSALRGRAFFRLLQIRRAPECFRGGFAGWGCYRRFVLKRLL